MMQKNSVGILFCLILLNSCSPTKLPVAIPVSTDTPLTTLTSLLTQTSAPTALPLLNVGRSSFLTLNSMAVVHSSEYDTDVWVVGDHGFIARRSSMGTIQRMDAPELLSLYDVNFVASNDGWIVGEDTVILHWNGAEWEVSKPAIVNSGWPYSYNLYSVAFSDPRDGWAAGCTHSEGGGYFLVYHWDGTSWTEVTLSEERNLWACVHDIVALSPTDVWMVGTDWNEGKEYGITVHWDGVTWQIVSELATHTIYSIGALSSDNIWAVTGKGTVLNWNGIEWSETSQLEFANSASTPIILARANDDIFIARDTVWHWNGNIWTDISAHSDFPVNTDIKGIGVGSTDEGGHSFIHVVDSFGVLYSFTYEKLR
jgi:photosystem II stability/assembly factor-like uncharacterized protein